MPYPMLRILNYAIRVHLQIMIRVMHKKHGFTLIEMMIALAIVALLLTVVAPNVTTILQQNRVAADINSISAAAQFARFTAVDEQVDVTLCPTANYSTCSGNWSDAKMVFIDNDGNGSRNGTETLLTTADAVSSTNTLAGISGVLTFAANGSVSQAATITICPNGGEASQASALIVNLYGRVATASDNDDDGVKEDRQGNALTCS